MWPLRLKFEKTQQHKTASNQRARVMALAVWRLFRLARIPDHQQPTSYCNKRSRKEHQNPQKKKTQSHDTSKIKQRAPKKIQNTKSKRKKAQHYDGSSTTSGLYRNWLVGLPSSSDAGTSPYLAHSARLPQLPLRNPRRHD
jgi:hypothetical protein